MSKSVIVLGNFLISSCLMFFASHALSDSGPNYSAASQKLIRDTIEKSEKLSPAKNFERAALKDIQPLTNVALSPDGLYLFFVTNKKQRKQLWLHHNKNGSTRELLNSNLIRTAYWSANSQYIIIRTITGIASIALNSLDKNQPVKVSNVISLDASSEQYFLAVDQLNPNHFYLSLENVLTNKSSTTENMQEHESLSGSNKQQIRHALYRMDINGQKQKLLESDKVVSNFLAPHGGEVRFIKRVDGYTNSLYQLMGDKETLVYQCHFIDACQLESFSANDNKLYIRSREQGELVSLWSLDLSSVTASTKPQLIHRDIENRFDLSKVIIDQENGTPLLVEYQTDFYRNSPLNDSIKQHLETIEASLISPILKLHSLDSSSQWLVIDENPNHVYKRYFLYDLKSQKLTSVLAEFIQQRLEERETKLSLRNEQLALRIPFQYQASDGMLLHAYLTLPRGIKIADAPMVVSPHGGPWSRETGDFKSSAQFLANRGYIVFEPNFRSSTGLGRNYILAANRDFGDGRVQQDIIDGVNYLLSQNIADKERLAIYGASFGGFSVLTGLSATPDLFQVGIAAMPSIDLSKTIKYYHESLGSALEPISTQQLFKYLAVDINDREDLTKTSNRSPDFHKDKIKKPLYIIAGARDKRVSILNIQQFVLELEAMEKQVLFFSAPRQGHTFRGELARDAYLYIVERALAKHLGTQMNNLPSKEVEEYIIKNTIINTIGKTKQTSPTSKLKY